MKPPNLKVFRREELLIVDQATQLARGLTAEAFKLDFDDFGSWPVDIQCYLELQPEERDHQGVFAQLFRYARPGPVLKDSRPDYFRLCLYDPAILKALKKEPGLTLEPLLVYILTHEFIHVARFVKFVGFFHQDEAGRRAEEEVVHQETFRLLAPIRVPGLEVVLNLYADHRLPIN